MPIEDDYEHHDFRDADDDDLPYEVEDVIGHLRDTLTHDRALKAIRNRFGVEPQSDEELEQLMEELIADAYNDGYDDWDDFPY